MLVECKACRGQISRRAYACPKCGHPNERVTRQLIATVAVLFVIAASSIWWRGESSNAKFRAAHANLMSPIVAEYEALGQDGTPTQRCQQSVLVARMYESGGDQKMISKWKSTAASDCRKAGMHADI